MIKKWVKVIWMWTSPFTWVSWLFLAYLHVRGLIRFRHWHDVGVMRVAPLRYKSAGPKWWRDIWANSAGQAGPGFFAIRADYADDAETLAHEMRHEWWHLTFGPLYHLMWSIVAAIAMLSGTDFTDNWFEEDARRHARRVVSQKDLP